MSLHKTLAQILSLGVKACVKTTVSGTRCTTWVSCNVMSLGTPLWLSEGSKDVTFTLRAWHVPIGTVYGVCFSLPACESHQVKEVRGFPSALSVIVFTTDPMKSVKACFGLQQQASATLDSVEEQEGWIVKIYCVFGCQLSLRIDSVP